MLKIKFWRVENVLLMKVLEQGDGIKREDFKFCASNGIEVKSISSPELTPAIIYVRGRAKEYDDIIVPREYSNAEEAALDSAESGEEIRSRLKEGKAKRLYYGYWQLF